VTGTLSTSEIPSGWQTVDTVCSDGSHVSSGAFEFYALSDGPLSSSDPTGVYFSQCLSGWTDNGFVSGSVTYSAAHLEFTVTQYNGWTYSGTFDGTDGTAERGGAFEGTYRVHASNGDCQGDRVMTGMLAIGCAMAYGGPNQYSLCNGASRCQ